MKSKVKNDLLLAAGFILAAAIAFSAFYFTQEKGSTVSVSVNGVKSEGYSLSFDIEKEIITENGINVFVIKDGKAYMKSADCPDKICVEHRPIKNSGETIVCLPHRVVLEIE